MKPEIKARWVAALRSGEYAQGKNALKSKDGRFCCLGVLCDLAAADGVGAWSYEKPSGAYEYDNYFVVYGDEEDRSWADLPLGVGSWAGLTDAHDIVVKADGHTELISNLNDQGRSFEKIADVIEEQL